MEYLFPFGWGELWGIADRTDYDLKRHQEHSGKDLTYFDQEENTRYIPYVVEPSLGADRMALAFLCDAYDEEVVGQDKNGKDDIRVVLHLHPALAPFKAAVLPLSKKLGPKAQEIHDMLSKEFLVDYDEAGSIGKRYRRQDEIGTPPVRHRGLPDRGRPEKGEGRGQLRHHPRPRHHGAGAPAHRVPPRLHPGESILLTTPRPSPPPRRAFSLDRDTGCRSHPLRKYAVESPASLW